MKITITIQVQRLPPIGGGKQSWRQHHMDESQRPPQTRCTGRHGEDRRSPVSFVSPVRQAATPLCLPGAQLFPLFWRARSVWRSRPRLPESSEMPTLPGISGPFNRALWQMSYQHEQSPESVVLLFCCCPAIGKINRLSKAPSTMSADESQKHELEVHNLLRTLVQCGENRLNCMRNIRELAELTPHLLCFQLRSGHSQFWNHLRTVAKVVNKQPTLEAKLAALIAVRKLVAAGNHWSFYLASRHEN